MKKLLVSIILGILSANLFASDCGLVKDTLLYIEIRTTLNYPIVMAGITKNIYYPALSKENGEKFLKSFYKQCYYTPSFLLYEDAIKECMRLKKDDDALESYKNQGQKLMNLVAGNGRERRIILDNGENIFIRITEIAGSYLVSNKELMNLPSITVEYDLEKIKEIEIIYVPLEISEFKKPSIKCFNRIFK